MAMRSLRIPLGLLTNEPLLESLQCFVLILQVGVHELGTYDGTICSFGLSLVVTCVAHSISLNCRFVVLKNSVRISSFL